MGILQLLTDNLGKLTDNIVPLGLAVFALALGFFSIAYLNRRRQMLHQERMASLIKGLHYAGVAREVFTKPRADSRDHLLRGLRWLFGGAGISGAMYGYETLQPAADPKNALTGLLVGLIPGLLGIAHLLFSWLIRNRSGRQATPQTGYRVASRRL